MRTIFILTILGAVLTTAHAGETDQKLWKRAVRLHEKLLTVDTHCDTPMLMLKPGFNAGKKNDAPESQVDFPRMKEGGLDAMFFAVYTGQKPRTPENYAKTYQMAHQMLDSVHSSLEKYSETASLALTADDARRIEKTGKRAIYIGMENGFPLGKEIRRVEEFYNRGVRYITLCHSFHNDLCDSSSDSAEPEHNGLSDFGKEVVAEMNRLGILIDCSHLSDKSFFDVIQYSKAPVIASHSSVRAVCRHDRNMSDEMIKTLAGNGGVIQICLLDDYVKEPDTTTQRYATQKKLMNIYYNDYGKMNEEEKAAFNRQWNDMKKNLPKKLPKVKELVDHIDHVVQLVGIDYVGIGSDFDGGGGLEDCNDVSQFPRITFELLKRGYSDEDIQKIWGANLFRVFRQAELVAGTLAELKISFRPEYNFVSRHYSLFL
ncbi:dipeptidase [Gaoshiqia sp. Z1-71]|uniref:dipeptidase n=1 Tax=Gaoshiqia hydrogeniformans TaxID=3290090 RepID=UPI003BF83182